MKLVASVLCLFTLIICPKMVLSQHNGDTPDKKEKSRFDIFQFRCVGPTRGGRVTAVAGISSQPSTFFMGATGGGVWKTEDYGINWKNVSDGYFSTPSIGAIRVAQTNPDIVYVGTGSDGIRSNVITGKGVYKSVDGGNSWDFIGLKKAGQIGAVEIHPTNPDIVFVAAIGQAFNKNKERGVYKTINGGKSWEHVLSIADSVGVADLEIAPGNADIIYATAWQAERKPWTIKSGGPNGGIYKSTNGGKNWNKLAGGLPDGIIGKIDLAVTPAAPGRLYALVEAPVGKGGLYISHDMGESFTLVSTKKELLDRPFYYCNVDADPNNADVVYVNSTQYFKSSTAGKSWSRIRTPHGDNHDMWINPNNSDLYIQANDGGANVTLNGGKSWSSQHNQATAELYQIETDDQYPYRLYAGQQDNSTIMIPSLAPYNAVSGATAFWQAVGGCETGPAVPKPGNPNIVYSNCKGRFGVYDKTTGQEKQYYVGAANMYGHNPKDLRFRFQRVSPIHVSPHDPNMVYHTSQYVHKTIDDGKTWEIISPDLTAFTPETQVISGSPITRDITGEEFYSTIYSIRESRLEKGVIWVGSNDGPVHVTMNGGKSWANVTPPGLAPGGRVDCVEPSPHNPAKAYFTVLRYMFGDWNPYVYKTEDYGKSWHLLSDGTNGIPSDYPVRVVREDPNRQGLLYAGTEFGLFISMDDGKSWHSFQQNLPVTPVTDIKIHEEDLVMSTMGRSFWIMDNLTPLHQQFEEALSGEMHIFKPKDAIRRRARGNFGSRNSIPQYPAAAAHIDYYLAEAAEGPIYLEISDPLGNIVRSFVNNQAKKDSTGKEEDMATGFRIQGETPDLSAKKGLHRFNWDLRHEGAWDKNESSSGRNGPMVSPATYVVKLSIGEISVEQSFSLMMDPRVEASGVTTTALATQESLALEIRDLLSMAKKLSANVKEKREKLKVKKENKNFVKVDGRLAELESALETAEGRYQTPMLVAQLNYLNGMVNRADQLPGKDAFERFENLENTFKKLKKRMEKLSSSKEAEMLLD